jgi:tetratricopeptide (TPR) repeat protein
MLAVLILTIGLVGCSPAEAPSAPTPVRAGVASSAWKLELNQTDRNIASTQARLATRPDQWLVEQHLAGLYQQRARLTGDYDDYEAAEAAISRAFATAPTGSGPFLGRASLNMTLHRLDHVEADLTSAEGRIHLDGPTRATIALTRANLAIERGHYDDASRILADTARLRDSMGLHVALASLAWKTGDFDAAETELRIAEAKYHGISSEPRAWFHLLRGLMDLERSQLDQAMAHYRTAADAMPGYWLVEEHIAEIHVLQGRPHVALPIYRGVVERAHSPALMGALAGVLFDLGQDSEARIWVQRASDGFSAQAERFPEAVAGHAVLFHLERGDTELALDMAVTNAANRPNPEALALLAQVRANLP